MINYRRIFRDNLLVVNLVIRLSHYKSYYLLVHGYSCMALLDINVSILTIICASSLICYILHGYNQASSTLFLLSFSLLEGIQHDPINQPYMCNGLSMVLYYVHHSLIKTNTILLKLALHGYKH